MTPWTPPGEVPPSAPRPFDPRALASLPLPLTHAASAHECSARTSQGLGPSALQHCPPLPACKPRPQAHFVSPPFLRRPATRRARARVVYATPLPRQSEAATPSFPRTRARALRP
jgi:hypothetical protein